MSKHLKISPELRYYNALNTVESIYEEYGSISFISRQRSLYRQTNNEEYQEIGETVHRKLYRYLKDIADFELGLREARGSEARQSSINLLNTLQFNHHHLPPDANGPIVNNSPNEMTTTALNNNNVCSL